MFFRRFLLFFVVALCLCLNVDLASACKGQSGKELWADNFQDVSTGWTNNERFHYANGQYEILAEPGEHGGFVITPPFGWDEGDLCVTFESSSLPEEGSYDEFCIKFLWRGFESGYSFCSTSTGVSYLERMTSGGDRTVFSFKDTVVLNLDQKLPTSYVL